MGTSIVFLLPALVFIWHLAGTTDFTPGGILPASSGHGALARLLALCMFGIGKAALMPFHRWLPAAMVAPTPVSALLHAVAVVKAGVFSVVKVIVYVFGLDSSPALAHGHRLAGGDGRLHHRRRLGGGAAAPTTSSAAWPTPPSASCPTW
jgi:multicomponent Na+:H+ antiporter subunit D